ncbi:MAG: hypothetical protein ACRC62_01620 [Microcoleus sp.]
MVIDRLLIINLLAVNYQLGRARGHRPYLSTVNSQLRGRALLALLLPVNSQLSTPNSQLSTLPSISFQSLQQPFKS